METNLGRFLAKRAQLSPRVDAVVEVERGRRFTYSELNTRANRVVDALRGQGVKAGDRVAFLLMNGVEYLESYFALAKLGAVMVPLNWRLVPEELRFIIADAGATVLLFDSEFDVPVTALRSLDTPIRTWIQCGDEESRHDWALGFDALSAHASEAEPEITAGPDDLLFIMYTSGTTGLPKGVVHTHATMAAASTTINMTADMRYRDRYLNLLPLFHVGALTPATSCVQRGASIIIPRAFDPNTVFDVIEQEAITTGLAVPAMLQFMWDVPRRKEADVSRVRWFMSGAAPVPVSLIEQYAEIGIEIHQVYGLTESGGPACLISPDDSLAKAGSTGPAFFHTDVRVVSDSGEEVSPGEVGEVIIRGAHVMKEYWNLPDATAEALRDGWLYSGDLATVDKEGFVYIQDRKKDMIISGGENIYPAEVERILAGHPDVRDVAVIGIPSSKWGESPLAIVVPRDGERVTSASIIEYCEGKLARFKVPKAVEFIDEIPRNPTGKILKRILRDRFPGSASD